MAQHPLLTMRKFTGQCESGLQCSVNADCNHLLPPKQFAMALTIATAEASPWQRYQSESHGACSVGESPADSSSTRDGVPSPHDATCNHCSVSVRQTCLHSLPRKASTGQISLGCSGSSTPYASSITMSERMTGTNIDFIVGSFKT